MLDTIITSVVTGVGFLLSLGYYPQIYRIWKTKSVEDLSVVTYLIFAIGTTVLLYGLYKNDIAIVGSFLMGSIGSWLVLLLTLYYRNREGL